MKTINYYEAAFMAPADMSGENWQHMHALVSNVITDCQTLENKPTVAYYVMENPSLDGLMVTIRSQHKLPAQSVPLTHKTLEIAKGNPLTIYIEMSRQRSPCSFNEKGSGMLIKHNQTVVGVEGLESWITGKLAKAGFTVKSTKILNTKSRHVTRKNSEFFIPSAAFMLSGTVFDCNLFEKAWLTGIGRNKAYGYGCIEVVSA